MIVGVNCFNSVVLDLLDLLLLWLGFLFRFEFGVCMLCYCVVLFILLVLMVLFGWACGVLAACVST